MLPVVIFFLEKKHPPGLRNHPDKSLDAVFFALFFLGLELHFLSGGAGFLSQMSQINSNPMTHSAGDWATGTGCAADRRTTALARKLLRRSHGNEPSSSCQVA